MTSSGIAIGIIAPDFPPSLGGMEVMAVKIAEAFSARHKVTVFTKAKRASITYPFAINRSLVGRTLEDLETLNAQPVDLWFSLNAGYSAIADRLKSPLVCYFHGNDFLQPWAVSSPFVMRALAGQPILSSAFRDLKYKYCRKQIKKGAPATAKILTNSANTKELITRWYPSLPQAVVCPPGVEKKFFEAEPRARSGTGYLSFLTVCRLTKKTRRKNVDGVLQALARLPKDLRYRYQIIGDGDDKQRLESLSARLGIDQHVQFLGRTNEAELLNAYALADLFILPVKASSIDVEGFGIVYIEANAFGVPVLGSITGGSRDSIIDEVTGMLLTDAEPATIAAGIERFAKIRNNFDIGRIRRFAEKHTWDLAIQRIESESLICAQI